MKKSLVIATLFLAAMGAQAADLDLSVGKSNTERTVSRLGVSNTVYGLETNASFTRTETQDKQNVNLTAVTVGKQLFAVGPVKVSAFAGPGFAQTKTQTGFGGVYGVALKYPLATNVDAVLDARRFQGKTRIDSVDGNSVTAGLAVKF